MVQATSFRQLPQMTDSEAMVEALAYVVVNHQLEAMRWLLDHGADANVKPERFHGGRVCCTWPAGTCGRVTPVL